MLGVLRQRGTNQPPEVRNSDLVQEARARVKLWQREVGDQSTREMDRDYVLTTSSPFHRRSLIGTSHPSQHRLLVAIDIIERRRIGCHDFPHSLVAGGYFYADKMARFITYLCRLVVIPELPGTSDTLPRHLGTWGTVQYLYVPGEIEMIAL